MDGLPSSFGEVSVHSARCYPMPRLNSKKTVRFRPDFGGKELKSGAKTAEKTVQKPFFVSSQSACLK